MVIWQQNLVNRLMFLAFCLVLLSEGVYSATLPTNLSAEQQLHLAQKISQNEIGKNQSYLTYWSKHEPFPSFGIGHFIWLPKNSKQPFKESFPQLIRFISPNLPPPPWITKLSPFELPWQNRKTFYTDFDKPKLVQLRNWLKNSKQLQAEFIYQRFLKQLTQAKKSLSRRQLIGFETKLSELVSSPKGLFAIIDYANFKGLGNNNTEVYRLNGKKIGWGLLDVILAMPSLQTNQTKKSLDNFIQTAKYILKRRTLSKQSEKRWLKGWYHRLDKYI